MSTLRGLMKTSQLIQQFVNSNDLGDDDRLSHFAVSSTRARACAVFLFAELDTTVVVVYLNDAKS